jgi:hypothetical protein
VKKKQKKTLFNSKKKKKKTHKGLYSHVQVRSTFVHSPPTTMVFLFPNSFLDITWEPISHLHHCEGMGNPSLTSIIVMAVERLKVYRFIDINLQYCTMFIILNISSCLNIKTQIYIGFGCSHTNMYKIIETIISYFNVIIYDNVENWIDLYNKFIIYHGNLWINSFNGKKKPKTLF